MELDQSRLHGALRRPAVKKHVGAIHIAGKLTLLQRKVSNVLLTNAYDTLTSKRTHSIDARTMMMMVGYNSNDTGTLKAALRGLVETVIEWDMLDQSGTAEWGVSSLLAEARLKDGVCTYAYGPALAEKLANPEVFALIDLGIQRRFASAHALALYENCYRFVRVRSTGWWELETFRKLMGVDESDYYRTFKHLNAKVIKPAVAEVNRTSNVRLTPELRKKGRAVEAIRFRVEENPQGAMDLAAEPASPTVARLRAQGISERLARGWIAEHGEAEVARRMDEVAKRPGVRSAAAYISTVMEGGGRAAPEAPADPEAQARAARYRARQEAERAEEDARSAEAEARRRRIARVEAEAARRSPVQREADRRLFMAALTDETERAHFKEAGWRSVLSHAAICAFWEERRPGMFEEG